MKTIFTLLATLIILNLGAHAATTYNVTTNKTWTAAGIPTPCANCTINVSPGVTLTIDKSVTCQNCTFSGGSISMTSFTLNLQYTGGVTTTFFNNTNFGIYGTGTVTVNAPLSLTNSTFTFNNTSTITTSYDVTLTNSTINLYDNSVMTTNGGGGTDISLISGSKINIGNGSSTSNAYFKVNGPKLKIYDTSGVAMGNVNNYYFNWGNYDYYPTLAGGAHSTNGTTNNINCGSSGQNSCVASNTYGPATINSSGTLVTSILPLVLVNFTAVAGSQNTAALGWVTEQEVNIHEFIIQRSQNGADWKAIGTEQATNNTSATDYSFTDASPLTGINYYRLAMVDKSGKTVFSDIRTISNALISGISFFPNPAKEYVNVSIGQSANTEIAVSLMNLSGQVLAEKKLSGANAATVSFPVSQYPAGIYILHVSAADGTRQNRQIIVSR